MPTKTKRESKPEAPNSIIPDRIIEAALRLAASRPWSKISLGEIAAEAGVTPSDLYSHFRGRQAILDAAMRQVDEAMLAEPVDFSESPRDRLFDVLMRRVDALAPHKQAIAHMADRLRMGRPDAVMMAIPAAPRLAKSVTWALEAAGISTAGGIGIVRVKAVGLIMLHAMRLWLGDDSEDHAKTMAALDRSLKRIEPLLSGAKKQAELIETLDEPIPPKI